jgi:Icc-related predicted phosphoesterase
VPLKFICLSDTHAQVPPKADERDVTAWLHAGDFCNMGLKTADYARLRRIEIWAKQRRVPILAVLGNHDCGHGTDFLRKCAHDITGKVVQVAPHFFVAGIGWCGIRFFDLPDEAALRPVCEKVLTRARFEMSAGDHCILLTHYPAYLPLLFPCDGDRAGFMFDCVREVIDVLKPLAVIQGHAHHLFASLGLFKTGGHDVVIANPGPDGGLLTVDEEKPIAVFEPWLPVPRR